MEEMLTNSIPHATQVLRVREELEVWLLVTQILQAEMAVEADTWTAVVAEFRTTMQPQELRVPMQRFLLPAAMVTKALEAAPVILEMMVKTAKPFTEMVVLVPHLQQM
jgi:hypothetical protein